MNAKTKVSNVANANSQKVQHKDYGRKFNLLRTV